MNSSQPTNNGKKELMRYAGMGTQMLVAIGIAVFLGLKADKWLKFSFPLLSWLLPLLAICGILYQVYKSTSKRKDDNSN
jgi:Mn2+/Fe2+ NRAMP family transporter